MDRDLIRLGPGDDWGVYSRADGLRGEYGTPLVFRGTRAACDFFVAALARSPREDDVEEVLRFLCLSCPACPYYRPDELLDELEDAGLLSAFIF